MGETLSPIFDCIEKTHLLMSMDTCGVKRYGLVKNPIYSINNNNL